MVCQTERISDRSFLPRLASLEPLEKFAKAGRAVFHGAADVLPLGLWEVAGTPTESAFDGTDMAHEVRDDNEDRIDRVVALKKK